MTNKVENDDVYTRASHFDYCKGCSLRRYQYQVGLGLGVVSAGLQGHYPVVWAEGSRGAEAKGQGDHCNNCQGVCKAGPPSSLPSLGHTSGFDLKLQLESFALRITLVFVHPYSKFRFFFILLLQNKNSNRLLSVLVSAVIVQATSILLNI